MTPLQLSAALAPARDERRSTSRTMPAAAIYLVGGPSGAGKDSMLMATQKILEAEGDESVAFIQRTITRDRALEYPLPVHAALPATAGCDGWLAAATHAVARADTGTCAGWEQRASARGWRSR